MKQEKVYIIGMVGDVSDDEIYSQVFLKFEKREDSLRQSGYHPVNPMRYVPRDTEWVEAIKICIPLMLTCDKISPLPDTWYSMGGMMEFEIARKLKMAIVIPE